MLVLSRNAGEAIKIGEDITVTVLDVKGREVKIDLTHEVEIRVEGVTAPVDQATHVTLSKKVGDEINIGDELVICNDITVRILGVHRNQVRLGVDAPREVIVDREEIYKRRRGIKET